MVKSNRDRPIIRFILGVVLVIGLPVGGLGLYWLATLPDVTALANRNPTTTALIEARRLQAKDQGRPFTVRWTCIPLDQISPHLRRAVIVAEDAAFFQHEGFDWGGMKEAAVRNLESGELQRGGSTITQQLAKNLYLTSEKSLARKATEALITRELEHKLAKKRILELYLNVVEWGEGVFGAEAAARHHFGKSASEVTAEEAALLAAILPAPRANDPLEVTPYLAKRQRWILGWMAKRYGTPPQKPGPLPPLDEAVPPDRPSEPEPTPEIVAKPADSMDRQPVPSALAPEPAPTRGRTEHRTTDGG